MKMSRWTKPVLALGLASGVLLSGLPLGNVVEAASAGEVVKKTTKTLTTKEKLSKAKKELEELRFAYMEKMNVVNANKLYAEESFDDFSEYSFNVVYGREAELARRYDEFVTDFKRVYDLYSNEFWSFDEKKSDAQKLADYTKRIARVKALNASGDLKKLGVTGSSLVKDVRSLEFAYYKLWSDEKLIYEKVKTDKLVLREANALWFMSIPIESKKVLSQYKKDLIGSGKSESKAEIERVKAMKMLETMFNKGTSELTKASAAYENSFKRAVNEPKSGNQTDLRLDELNAAFGSFRAELNKEMASLYKKAKLKGVPVKFELK